MGTHSHATTGKAASKRTIIDPAPESTSDKDRIAQLEAELAGGDAAIRALKEEVSRLNSANEKLADMASHQEKIRNDVQKSRDNELLDRASKRLVNATAMNVAAIEQKKEWANSLVHDMQEIVAFAGLSREHDIGQLAMDLSGAATRLEKWCEATLARHRLDSLEKPEVKA